MINIANHPCFNAKSRHKYARVHLPVAPKCNIQCNFCDRRYDCLNESRPGVSSVILSPRQALAYLERAFAGRKDISVAGIAGPGDPFANPEETMETLRLVRRAYPDLLLCVATNGLNLLPYIEELASLKVSHVSITINAVDPDIGKDIYAWVRDGVKIYRGREAAEALLSRQMEALAGLKRHGITAKVNSIIIPGINAGHISKIAQEIAAIGADIMNPIPLYPARGSAFEHAGSPSADAVSMCREGASRFISVMSHCARCRADAVGLLGEKLGAADISSLRSCASMPVIPGEDRPYIACASREGALVNLHLGHADKFYVFGKSADGYKLVAVRTAPKKGTGAERWAGMADLLSDCRAVLAENAGDAPRAALGKSGISVVTMTGLIEDGLSAVYNGAGVDSLSGRSACGCGECAGKTSRLPGCGCSGSGQGCG